MFVNHLYVFGEMSVSVFCPFFVWAIFFHDVDLLVSCLYILENNPLLVVLLSIIFFHSESCLFTLFIISFAVQKFSSLIKSHLFVFISNALGGGSKKILLSFMSKCVLLMFSSKSFTLSGLIFKSLIHFEFIFVYDVRKCSNFILVHVAVQFSQDHLLKRLSSLHCIFLPPLLKISYP